MTCIEWSNVLRITPAGAVPAEEDQVSEDREMGRRVSSAEGAPRYARITGAELYEGIVRRIEALDAERASRPAPEDPPERT